MQKYFFINSHLYNGKKNLKNVEQEQAYCNSKMFDRSKRGPDLMVQFLISNSGHLILSAF